MCRIIHFRYSLVLDLRVMTFTKGRSRSRWWRPGTFLLPLFKLFKKDSHRVVSRVIAPPPGQISGPATEEGGVCSPLQLVVNRSWKDMKLD